MCSEGGNKAVKGLEGMSCKEQLKAVVLPSLEKRSLRGNLMALHSFQRHRIVGGGAVLSSIP